MDCLLCLKAAQPPEMHIHINSQNGRTLGIADIIQTYFWFQVDTELDESSSICLSCWHKLNEFHTFYLSIQCLHDLVDTKIVSVNKTANQEIDDLCAIKSKIQQYETKINIRTEDVEEGRLVQVEASDQEQSIFDNDGDQSVNNFEDCEETYSQETISCEDKLKINNSTIEQSESKNKTSNSKVNECQFCEKKCPTKMSLAVHLARSHNNINHVCPTCRASYKDENALQKHVEYMHVPIHCSYCPKVIKNKRNLETHERAVHKREQRYFCETCGKGFFHRYEKAMHEKNIHTNISHKCSKCAFTTKYSKSMDVHLTIHTKDLPFSCTICHKQFGRKLLLNRHIKRHLKDHQ